MITQYTYPNGDTYLGPSLKNLDTNSNQKSGPLGKYTFFKNKATYIGNFNNDQFHGSGIIIFNNGDVFEGNFQNNKIHGKGKYFWADGISFVEGDYENNELIGNGIYKGEDQCWEGSFYQNMGAVGLRCQLVEKEWKWIWIC